MNFDEDRFRALTKEDYNNKLDNVIKQVNNVKNSKLFIRLLNTDRMIIYSALGNMLGANCQIKFNRNELDFISAIACFISNYMLDDSEATIRYKKYDSDSGQFEDADKNERRAEPYLDHINSNEDKVVREDGVIEVLEFYEKKQLKYIELLKKENMYDGSLDKKEYINYDRDSESTTIEIVKVKKKGD